MPNRARRSRYAVPFTAPPQPYFVGDFRNDLQDFTAFDNHDANLGSTVSDPIHGNTVGCVIQAKPPPWYSASGYSCRVVTSNAFPSSSVSGDATVLWQPGNYSNAWEQAGAHTWFRCGVLFPNNLNSTYPGVFNSQSTDGLQSTWRILMEWHIDETTLNAHGGFTAPSSSVLGIAGSSNQPGGPCLLLRPLGGPYGTNNIYYIKETNQVQTKVNSGNGNNLGTIQLLQFNHWYDILIYQEFSSSVTTGYMEWWVDGNLRFADHVSTLVGAQDGTQVGVAYEAGLYRSDGTGLSNETVYIAAMISGPTRASVGA